MMDNGTEILFSDGIVSKIESGGTLTSEWEDLARLKWLTPEGWR